MEAHELPEPPDITEVVPLDPRNPKDAAFLEEVRTVFERHKYIGRVGLWLIHQHRQIEVGPDQAMVEFTYPETQEQVIRPVAIGDLDPEQAVQTLFQF